MIFSSTSFWQSGIKVQIRIFSYVLAWSLMGRNTGWCWGGNGGSQVVYPSRTVISDGVFTQLGRWEAIPGIPEMGENSYWPKKLLAVLQEAFYDFIQLCSCSVSAPGVGRCPLGQPRRGWGVQYCQMGSRGNAVPAETASTLPCSLTCRCGSYCKDLFKLLSWDELGPL